MSSSLSYRPEIDGLRALAVLAVLFFHAGLGFPGGYVGVDIFFVISGYLITSIILRELRARTFSLVNFWERRARRILPAGVVMVLVSMLAGWFLLLPSDFAALGKSAAAQAVFAANVYFWRTTNYFAGPADEQPLLHNWSLAVEEQFYMVVPLLLLVLFRFRVTRKPPVLALVLGAGFVASLALSVWLLPRMPAVTFYLLPTRAWELLGGALVALVPAGRVPGSRWQRELLVGGGLLGMVLPCFLYTRETAFPGLAALPPCLGAILFIFGSSSPPTKAGLPWLARFFTLRPVVFIGLISYSLYLWHWPLVAFSHYWALEEIPLWHRWSIVGASLGLAVLSWKFLETPFRKRRLGRSRRSVFSWAFGGSVAVAVFGVSISLLKGVHARFPEQVRKIEKTVAEASQMRGLYPETTLADAILGRFIDLSPEAGKGMSFQMTPELLVWGDSQAGAILPAFKVLAEEQRCKIQVAWHAGIAPALNYAQYNKYSFGEATVDYNQAVFDHIARNNIPKVLLVARWHGNFNKSEAGKHIISLPEALLETVVQLRAIGCKPYILKGIPNHRSGVPRMVFLREIFGKNISSYLANSESFSRQWDGFQPFESRLEAAGAIIIDIFELMIEEETGECRVNDADGIYFYDHVHFSPHGARFVRAAFREIFHR